MEANEKDILKNLKNGKYDGTRIDFNPYGSVKRGGRTDRGVYIKDGQIVEFKDVTTKFFNGEENEKNIERSTYIPQTDGEKLDMIRKYGYKMYEHEDARKLSKEYYEKRDAINREAREVAKESSNPVQVIATEIKESETPKSDVPKINDNSSKETNPNFDVGKDNGKTGSSVGVVVGIITVAVAFAGIAWLTVKNAPKIKSFLKEKVTPKFKKKSLDDSVQEMECPSCAGKMRLEKGIWKCNKCDYEISSDNLQNAVFWFCDGCGAFLNTQSGFDCNQDSWTCSECGCMNDITAENILNEYED